MEAKKDEEEGVDAADSIVFIARVYSFFLALAPRALPPSLAPIQRAHGFLTALQTLGKSPLRNPHRSLFILAANPSNLAPKLETPSFPF